MNTNHALTEILKEYERARLRHKPMSSVHEAYAIILEEVDEMWDDIKKGRIEHAHKEAIQVGAMILAFLVEVEN